MHSPPRFDKSKVQPKVNTWNSPKNSIPNVKTKQIIQQYKIDPAKPRTSGSAFRNEQYATSHIPRFSAKVIEDDGKVSEDKRNYGKERSMQTLKQGFIPKFCTNCGYKFLDVTHRFCGDCGKFRNTMI